MRQPWRQHCSEIIPIDEMNISKISSQQDTSIEDMISNIENT